MSHSSNEQQNVIFKIKRNPIGLVYVYAVALVALGASLGLLVWASNEVFDFTLQDNALAILGVIVVSGLAAIQLFIVTIIYWSSSLTLTTDEVKQVLQKGLFHKKTSRLGLPNIEDVTVLQKGPLSAIFNYGTLRIETAGEQSNFDFKYCSAPADCARVIMDARIDYLESENNTVKSKDLQR